MVGTRKVSFEIKLTKRSLKLTEVICRCGQTYSAYHLYGKPGNSGENSNGTVHPGGNFPRKKVIPFEVLPFSRFYRNGRNFLYHLSGLLVPGFLSRESEKFTGIL